jgi:hypothetical protein
MRWMLRETNTIEQRSEPNLTSLIHTLTEAVFGMEVVQCATIPCANRCQVHVVFEEWVVAYLHLS